MSEYFTRINWVVVLFFSSFCLNNSFADSLEFKSELLQCCDYREDLNNIITTPHNTFIENSNNDRVTLIKNIDSDSGALYVSIAGVLVSLLVSGYLPFWIDKRNKKKSIVDDFWVRQVIYPRTINHMLDFSSYISSHRDKDIDFNEENLENFQIRYKEQLNYIGDFRLMVESMGYQMDFQNLFDDIQRIQDCFIQLCFSLDKQEDFDRLKSNNKKFMVSAIKSIHKVQVG